MKLITTNLKRSFYRVWKVIAITVLGTVATVSVPLTFLHRWEWALVSLTCIAAMVLLRPRDPA